MTGTGYIIMEEIGCEGSDCGITECVGVFEHKMIAEIAYEAMVMDFTKEYPEGAWWLYLVEIVLGEMHPVKKQLMSNGINGEGQKVETRSNEYVDGSFIER